MWVKRLRGIALAALVGALACDGEDRAGGTAAPAAAPLAELETAVYLIGDAGNPARRDPVLAALQREVARDPARSLVVFLGDNVYPRGLPPAGAPDRAEMERRLLAQIEVVRDTGTRAIFIPGNHDWNNYDTGGWEAIRRQGRFVAERGGPAVALLPGEGCPGPSVRDVEEHLRLVALDTQWWLHDFEKPAHPASECPQDSEAEVLDALAAALGDTDGRHVLVVGHHPLASGGLHGGYFGWRDHIFPLRARKSWLWIPLPGIGSAYPAARRRGLSNQDLSGLLNRKMREGLEGVFAKSAPLAYAAGHEHNLQVLKGKDVKHILVSGAGYFGHLSRAEQTPATVFARALSGYMRMEVGRNGQVRLAVITVDASAHATEVFTTMLED
jgi:hypothetical protein